jgi:hypothetical protein
MTIDDGSLEGRESCGRGVAVMIPRKEGRSVIPTQEASVNKWFFRRVKYDNKFTD